MANLSIQLQATISAADTTITPSPTPFTRNFNNPTLQGTVFSENLFFQASNTGSAVALPAPTVWVVYVKNNDAGTNLTVTWTTVGGGLQTFVLPPGSVFTYFCTSETAGGVTALTLTASAGTINCEVFTAK
jgi:hypothetical protein